MPVDGPRFLATYNDFADQYWVILSDYMWWAQHQEELEDWLDDHVTDGRAALKGMTVRIGTKEELNWFTLRWQS